MHIHLCPLIIYAFVWLVGWLIGWVIDCFDWLFVCSFVCLFVGCWLVVGVLVCWFASSSVCSFVRLFGHVFVYSSFVFLSMSDAWWGDTWHSLHLLAGGAHTSSINVTNHMLLPHLSNGYRCNAALVSLCVCVSGSVYRSVCSVDVLALFPNLLVCIWARNSMPAFCLYVYGCILTRTR